MLFNWVVTAGTVACAASLSFLPKDLENTDEPVLSASPDVQAFEDALEALRVMQDDYFEPWLGTWPHAIDWTAAVMGTLVSGALQSLSHGLDVFRAGDGLTHFKAKENLINLYFSQVLSFYFGQDHLSIRGQAYDDILWVVLGWLETTRLIELHTTLHYDESASGGESGIGDTLPIILRNQSWHGNIWTAAYAHRARVFWELAEKGWDTKLCGGGMTWNPRLEPYKNAITNELFISASTSMYLYFPGDANRSPFYVRSGGENNTQTLSSRKPHVPKHLIAATDGYTWITKSNFLNHQGLYIDGFHISGYNNKSDPNTKCDSPDQMVYTYNQGVILTGQLGLWKASGDGSFLQDGHRLIRNAIKATGWDLQKDRPADDLESTAGRLPPWRGLGRAGVLEEACDVSASCSQDAQTFKGIFFHHFTAFCAPLELPGDYVTENISAEEFASARGAHKAACRRYSGWVKHNAKAAAAARDESGRFGMWWTAGLLNITTDTLDKNARVPVQGVDYRNEGVPDDPVWVLQRYGTDRPLSQGMDQGHGGHSQHPMKVQGLQQRDERAAKDSDPNNRGRGRTVETQAGGMAVLRAAWELSR